MKTGLIYKITNKHNNMSYIGKTTRSLATRWEEHIKAANQNANYILSRAIRKYDKDDFNIEVILDNIPEQDLNFYEKFYIKHFNTYKGKGYNATPGGDGGFSFEPWNKGKKNIYSKETLDKMSKAKIGKIPTNLDQLAALAKQRTGAKHQNVRLANVYVFTTKELIANNVCLAEWCRNNSINTSNLRQTALGKRKQCSGYYAIYQ